MKRQGFTLVELLVVIAIIALLMGILMPALSRVRQIAFRMVCGTNLSGIGKAMLIYANDYQDELPKAGGRNSTLGGSIADWTGNYADNRFTAFGLDGTGGGGQATITSCFYLLIKYAEVTPKSFICKGDAGVTEFMFSDLDVTLPDDFELIDAWDFGPYNNDTKPREYCSYSYHMPFSQYALTTSGEPGMAVAADPNPWIKSPGADAEDFTVFKPDIDPWNGSTEKARLGNSYTHQKDGQNVMFLDTHVDFAKRPWCGIEEDNIYTHLPNGVGPPQFGKIPTENDLYPGHRKDSLLIHDGLLGPTSKRICFLPYITVRVDGALMPICEVTAGQNVGGSVQTQVPSLSQKIEYVQEHTGTFECYDIVLENSECITVATSHVFLVAAPGRSGLWMQVYDLRKGIELMSLQGPVSIKCVAKRATPFVGKVYNLKVEDSNSYFLGRNGIVVRDW